jgi:MFS family permease
MVLVLEKKFLEGTWWIYGLTLAATQLVLWIMLGRKLNPSFDIWQGISLSRIVLGTFFGFIVFPFIVGRLGMKRLFWASLVGIALGDAAYFLLASIESARAVNLLPFTAFIQLAALFILVGLVIELGHYVYQKVIEE